MQDTEQGPARCHDWRREALVVIAILTAVTCLFYYEIIFLGRTFLPLSVEGVMGARGPYGYDQPFRSDPYRLDIVASTWQSEPFARKVSDELNSGRFPLWNENQAFGMPLLADAVSGSLNPLRLPLLLDDSALTWDVFFLVRTLLGGIATYLFARCVGLSPPARYFLAIAYVFSGHFLLLGNNHWIEAYFLLPVILLGTELAIGGRPRLGFVLSAAAVALTLLVGMPEASLGVLLLGGAYGGYRLLDQARLMSNRRDWAVRVAMLVAAWLVGIALAAPLLVPMFELVTHASEVTSRRDPLGLNFAPISDIVIWFMPFLKGFPLYLNIGSIATYAGATVLLLAIYGLYPAKTEVYQRLVPFAALAAALLLAKTFGMPGLNEIGRLPGLNVTHIPKWFSPVTGFCLTLLASVGVHHLAVRRARPAFSSIALGLALLLVAFGVRANWDAVTREPNTLVYFSVGIALFFATAVWLAIRFLPRRPLWLPGVACCFLLTVELFMLAPRGVYQDRYDRFVEAPYVTFLKDQQALVVSRIFGADGLLFPNFASAFGLHDIRVLNAFYVDRYWAYIQNFISPDVADRFVGTPYSPQAEKDALILDNPWFDLTGVRYVLVAAGSPMATALSNVIVDQIYAAETQSGRTHVGLGAWPVTIGGITKSALFEHPPDTVQYPVRIEPENAMLHFAVGLSPEVSAPSFGDGVGFEVVVKALGGTESVYRRDIDPKNDPSQRRWIDDSVDLSRFVGQDIVLSFVTHPLETPGSDWAVWGDIRLAPTDGVGQQYTMVYNHEVRIFENQHALPRAFLVQEVLPADTLDGALAVMKGERIDPRQVAVVEGAPEDAIAALGLDGGTAAITAYHAQHVSIDVAAESPSLLVLTDTVYPGWIATVDGQETPIYATDVAFRGVFVPAGQHLIKFTYDPMSFRIGVVIALLGLLAMAAVVIGSPSQWVRRAKPRFS